MTGRSSPIASALPGRIRLRHPLLRQPDRLRDAAARLAQLEGLRVAESNPAVGSLLVLYDPAALDPATVEAAVTAALEPVLHPGDAPAADPEAGPPPAHGREVPDLKRRINRAAKIGMMGSMAATLAALAVGKRLHAGAGTLFVALMLVHMTVQRKRLFQ
ncbi:hypothetical protein HL658_13965 [Azospirillum sp. RWY-5-1]|uniref:HMA domain-containing protein n=1 Tax=Azospirillum oleiclasticum TaxID=2735135 RepID=A0ABX2T9D6_9PROT|nr:hypothetical protein [Azospirillum oleiclasticum]NYZ13655.1 hypothetical protein [Azospirillum oleiclasticum]NYZ20927.1 hypothetical protein [Azospirillum oleiclasticum]